jgi:hypothetical protein
MGAVAPARWRAMAAARRTAGDGDVGSITEGLVAFAARSGGDGAERGVLCSGDRRGNWWSQGSNKNKAFFSSADLAAAE